jgi:hypothetical protein
MPALESNLRKQLERVIIEAREVAEGAAVSSLQKRAVHEAKPYPHFKEAERKLRNKLRAKAKQKGDIRNDDDTQSIERIAQELGYEYWHRMLFARFLAENNLLMHPDGIAVSLEECEELAQDANPPAPNGFVLAARYASTMLPQIFRTDDVLLTVEFAPEHRLALERLLADLPQKVFLANDSLGWCYQFWQAQRKEEVNASGNKIGADELPAVTQLFTEDYMVDFLLDNTLGAWWAGKVAEASSRWSKCTSEEECRQIASMPGCPWKYLRFIQGKDGKWAPAAGTFDGWPKSVKELKCLDPCMGSGHFVVAMFERLVSLRMEEEKLDEAAAVAAVIQDNLFGLEIDPRCTQIAAFNLALAAWRRVGHSVFPAMNLACSGLAPNTDASDWLAIAGDNEKLKNGMERLYRLFENAPVLGSLINPRAEKGDLLEAGFHELQPLLEKALAQETKDDTAHEMAVTASGLAKAAEILAGQFTLVATNVPYLGAGKQDEGLRTYLEESYPLGASDLAVAFVLRALQFSASAGSLALVTPHNWLFVTSNTELRELLLGAQQWNVVARLGEHAFESSAAAGAFPAMIVLTSLIPAHGHQIAYADVTAPRGKRPIYMDEKAMLLRGADGSVMRTVSQSAQLRNPDSRVTGDPGKSGSLLGDVATVLHGQAVGDNSSFNRYFWEVDDFGEAWEPYQTPPEKTALYEGRNQIVLWEKGAGRMARLADQVRDLNHKAQQWRSGKPNWGRRGVAVNLVGVPKITLFTGEIYSQAAGVIVPADEANVPALWEYTSSGQFTNDLQSLDARLAVTIGSVPRVPFDLGHWQKVAAEKYPHGLPKPFSSDPTQWLFNGHPAGADQPLHVAVARLLGYQWPRQTGSSFTDCPALVPDGLETLADEDGIVCLPAVRTEESASDRLIDLLRKAYGKGWSDSLLHKLLIDAGCKSDATLDDWLQNQFFEQHFKLFHHRPFIWHIWDGRKDGFSALVNCHKLNHKTLENLTYSYLGDWITAQSKSNKPGADLRLGAAQELQGKLKLILEGDSDFDIFVRWKPLNEQAIGWHPDLNDGVRMNIRPFIEADILRKKPNIKWTKDRGKEPQRDKAEFPWFWDGNSFTGDRLNDIHLTIAEKHKARASRKNK